MKIVQIAAGRDELFVLTDTCEVCVFYSEKDAWVKLPPINKQEPPPEPEIPCNTKNPYGYPPKEG